MTTREDRLFQIAPADNHITPVPLRWRSGYHSTLPEGFAVVAGYGAVWLSTTDLGEVLRVDPSSGRVVVIEDDHGIGELAVGDEAVWVSEQNECLRIDATTTISTGTAQSGRWPPPIRSAGVAYGEGSVWAAKHLRRRLAGLACVHDGDRHNLRRRTSRISLSGMAPSGLRDGMRARS